MVDEIVTRQELIDAKIDAADLGEFTNEDKVVTPRYGTSYKSAPMIAREYEENGATRGFNTLAEFDAVKATIPAYTVVTISEAGANQGQNIWDGANLTKSAYDPVLASKKMISDSILGTQYEPLEKPEYTLNVGVIDRYAIIDKTFGQYRYTSAIFISAGTRINFKSSGTNYCPLAKTTPQFYTGTPLISLAGTADNFEFSYVAEEPMYITMCSMTTVDNFDLEISIAPSPGLKKEIAVELGNIQNAINRVEESALNIKEINVEKVLGRGYGALDPILEVNTDAKTMQIYLFSGDKLNFDAKQYKGVILQEWDLEFQDHFRGYPIISNTIQSEEINSYEYTATKNMYVRISGYVENSVKVNNLNPKRPMLLGNWLVSAPAVVRDFGLYQEMMITAWFDISKGQTVRLTDVIPATYSICVQYPDTSARCILSSLPNQNDPTKRSTLEWVADSDCRLSLSAHKDAKIYLIDESDSSKDTGSYFVPPSVVLGDIERVFATSMNYILKLENVGGVEKIATSEDLGKTWKYADNILGDITAYHFFSDGTIMLCSPTKVFWSTNYTQWNESTIYDHDGSIFVPTNRHFFAMQTGDKIDFVGDTEIHSWGDYVAFGEARIWYTVDNARTIKCSIKFGTTPIGGVVRNIRHTHRVYYHTKTNYWYLTTGDDGNECMIIRGRYNVDTDTWDWQILGEGIEYKFGNIMIDDNNIAYVITDYTDASLQDKKGIYRVHASNLGDISKYRIIYKCDPSEWGQIAPLNLMMDNNGNKVLLPDYLGGGYMWVARDGLEFKRVSVPNGILLTYTIGENYNGDIYCVVYEGGSNLRLSSGSYNLTRILRENGITDFMRGTKIVSGLTTSLS